MSRRASNAVLTEAPPPASFIAPPEAFGNRFTLFIDTEEEFDWGAPFARGGHSVNSLKGLEEGQRFFESHGVRPVYLVDYPIIESDEAVALLRTWYAAGTCDVGAQLHPWVNPPFAEEVNNANSYAGHLPEPLERAKMTALRDRIVECLGVQPLIYRAGRYGVGPGSAQILKDLGFVLDSSVRSNFDYSGQEGPDFLEMPLRPYRTGPSGTLLELPLTTAFTGPLWRWGKPLYRRTERVQRIRGALAKTGLLSRVALTPEGVPAQDAARAIDTLLARGIRIFNLSFHSPSLEPGHTPYVRTEEDLARFYAWFETIFAHFRTRGVTPASQDELLRALAQE